MNSMKDMASKMESQMSPEDLAQVTRMQEEMIKDPAKMQAMREMMSDPAKMQQATAEMQSYMSRFSPSGEKDNVNIQVGDKVQISGLKARPDLNGCIGTVLSFSQDSGRYVVRVLAPYHSDPEMIALKPANLAPGGPRAGSQHSVDQRQARGTSHGGAETSDVMRPAHFRPMHELCEAAEQGNLQRVMAMLAQVRRRRLLGWLPGCSDARSDGCWDASGLRVLPPTD